MALLCRAGRPRDPGTRHDQMGIGPDSMGYARGHDRTGPAESGVAITGAGRPYRAARPFYHAGSAGGLPSFDMHREELYPPESVVAGQSYRLTCTGVSYD